MKTPVAVVGVGAGMGVAELSKDELGVILKL
jgi:hypothetical protein